MSYILTKLFNVLGKNWGASSFPLSGECHIMQDSHRVTHFKDRNAGLLSSKKLRELRVHEREDALSILPKHHKF
jgi:hypothetical protein